MSLLGEIFIGRVEDIMEDGRGIVRHPSGLAVFVPGVCLAEYVCCKITEHKERWAMGELRKILEPSDNRIKVQCRHQGFVFPKCGGCSWMHIDYSTQLEYKRNFLKKAVISFDKNFVAKGFNIRASEKIFAYRNRAKIKTDGHNLGFNVYQSDKLAPIKKCIVLSEKNQDIFLAIKNSLPNLKWKNNKSSLTVIAIDEKTDLESNQKNHAVEFQQANSIQNDFMRSWLRDQISSQDLGDTCIELFSGRGNFTEILSEKFSPLYALEAESSALEKLNEKFNQNRTNKVFGKRMDLFKPHAVAKFIQQFPQAIEAEILVLDPPRSGFSLLSDWINVLKKMRTLIYISCKPSTWARDIKELYELGFVLKKVQGVDQFPHTPHLEVLSVLERRTLKRKPMANKKLRRLKV